MLLETPTPGGWLSDFSSGLVATVIGGLIVLFVQLVASPRADRVPIQQSITSVSVVSVRVREQLKSTSAAPVSAEGAVIGGVVGLGLMFVFFSVVLGLSTGIVVGIVGVGIWCAIRTSRRGLWAEPSFVITSRLILNIGAVIYAWASVLTFERQGQNWATLVDSAVGEGEGMTFALSSMNAFFSNLTPERLMIAISILGTVALASMMLGLALAAVFQWACFLSVTTQQMRYFTRTRLRGAHAFLAAEPKDVLFEAFALAPVIFLSPTFLFWFIELLQSAPGS